MIPTCSTTSALIFVPKLVAFTERAAAEGKIDPTSGLYKDPVFLISGLFDTVIVPGKVWLFNTESYFAKNCIAGKFGEH